MQRLDSLEARLSDVASSLSDLQSAMSAQNPKGILGPPLEAQIGKVTVLRLGIITLFPALISIGLFGLERAVWISLIIPLPFGFLLGLVWRGRHPKGYALLGVAVGIIEMAAALILIALDEGGPTLDDGIGAFIMYVIGAAVLFLAGGLFGDIVERIEYPETTARPRLATRVVGGITGNREEPNKTLILLIQALGPSVLGLVGTFVTLIGGAILAS
jgi:hypothetical protein